MDRAKPMTKTTAITRAICFGLLASAILLGVYITVLTLVSGWDFTVDQFSQFWYFVLVLAIGFGVQVHCCPT